jgi:hypothetical protein
MIDVACPCLQPAQYRPATAYCVKLGKSGTRRSPEYEVPVERLGRPLSEFQFYEVAGEPLVAAISGPPVRRFQVGENARTGDGVTGV